jgi:hypothetical protein
MLVVSLLAAGLAASPVEAQQSAKDSCSVFADAAVAGEGPLPQFLLADEDVAIPCLVGTPTQLAPTVTSPEIDPKTTATMNRVTAALGLLIDRSGMTAIDKIRAVDNLSVAQLLAYGSRTTDKSTRDNSMVLLSNIVDNSTVCVVLDQMADPALAEGAAGLQARANLLASVSVVAPWAMKSNYEQMRSLAGYLEADLADEKDVDQTRRLLTNFIDRLDYQTTLPAGKANMNVDNEGVIGGCRSYVPAFKDGAFSIDYQLNQ